MLVERAAIALHCSAVVLGLAAALVWPRAGQAALMVPLGGNDTRDVLSWASGEDVAILKLDTASGQVVARASNNSSLLRAIGFGIVPVAITARSCDPIEVLP